MRKIIIAIGIIMLTLPTVLSHYDNYKQERLMLEWEESLQLLNSDEETVKEEVSKIPDEEIDYINSTLDKINKLEFSIEDINMNLNVESVIIIKKIDLIQPIIEGTSMKNLNKTITSFKGTGKPWTKGNYALAGHRSIHKGLHFNRLNEVNMGDIVLIVDKNNIIYEYEITEKKITHKSNVQELMSRDDLKEITLITCHPFGEVNPSKRLVLKGVLKKIVKPEPVNSV